jgi:glycosyltransferase involved in cell wall biosynthesis
VKIAHLVDGCISTRLGGVEKFVNLLSKSFFHQDVFDAGCFGGLNRYHFSSVLKKSGQWPDLKEYSLIHVHQLLPWGLPGLIQICREKPVVYSLHDYFLFCSELHQNRCGRDGFQNPVRCGFCKGAIKGPYRSVLSFFRNRLAVEFLENVSKIHLPNKELIHCIPKYLHFKCEIIPYAVDCNKSRVLPEQRKGFLVIGPDAPHKGIRLLIKELGTLSMEQEIHWYGPGAPKDLPDFVKHKGILNSHEAMASYKALILPSIWKETGPMVLLEALKNHIPVLARVGSLASCYEKLRGVELFSHGKEILKFQTYVTEFPDSIPDTDAVMRLFQAMYQETAS